MNTGILTLVPHESLPADHTLAVLRHPGGEVSAWMVPIKEGRIPMPDRRWSQGIYDCQQFGIAAQSDHEIITCRDKAVPEGWTNLWQWDVAGKSLHPATPDLPNIRVEQREERLILLETTR